MARPPVKTGVNLWVSEQLVERLDRHLAELEKRTGVPGAKISRSAFIAALVEREIGAEKPKA
jgi:hypothetical protein